MIRLREMTEGEFCKNKPSLVEGYAQDISRNYRIPIDDARTGSASQIDGQLNQGASTPNQFLYIVLLDDGNAIAPIGYLWLDVDDTKHRCFIHDIYLHREFRGKGWGRKTLELVETTMKERGIGRIGLHVLSDNAIARRLYEKLGYQDVGVNMQNWLTA